MVNGKCLDWIEKEEVGFMLIDFCVGLLLLIREVNLGMNWMYYWSLLYLVKYYNYDFIVVDFKFKECYEC